MSKRARLDISLAIAFLCTRVTRSTIEDWGKLRRLLQYIKGTINMPRIIGALSLTSLMTYVDASYGVHHDMRGHTGGLITMGVGCIHTKSSKQRLNTKSSCETEVVGTSDYIPWTVWIRRVLQYQGYKVVRNLFYQDNESAIKIETNGMKSCGDKSRHVNIRYFFIKDIISREDIEIKHRGTELMISDYLTKPLQGGLFRRLRDTIMGLILFPPEEHVGNNITVAGVKNDSPRGNEHSSPTEYKEELPTVSISTDDEHSSARSSGNSKFATESEIAAAKTTKGMEDIFKDDDHHDDDVPRKQVRSYADVLKASRSNKGKGVTSRSNQEKGASAVRRKQEVMTWRDGYGANVHSKV